MRPCPGHPMCPPVGPCAHRLTRGWSRVGAQVPALGGGAACKPRDMIQASQVQPDASLAAGHPRGHGAQRGQNHLAWAARQPPTCQECGCQGPSQGVLLIS